MSKLYRTSGTGNAQQTLDVNDEKIKIYADETSLDADLANIGENEIVATNEEDSQREGTQYPVDVVQDGNMNAVTSNAVYDAINGVYEYTNSGLGITLRKNGKVCQLYMQTDSLSGQSSGHIYAGAIPADLAPATGMRSGLLNNSTDTFIGQAAIRTNGDLQIYKAGGGTFASANYAAWFTWII